ncbi:MAG: DUF928 domain-containing protein [Snowella sp.]|nr:DUF928 domain-containing protein [Snowella sp.]
MNWLKTFPLYGVILFAASPLMAFSSMSYPQQNDGISPQQISLQFPTVRDRGAPITTGGGGTRGPGSGCLQTKEGELSVNALTPNYSNIATTASTQPVFYYYLPATAAKFGELVITDESDQPVYQTIFNLPTQAGIIRLAVSPTKPLSADKFYQWSFKIICNPKQRSKDIVLEGTLEYQPLGGQEVSSLAHKDPLEKAKFYAQKGIWLDTLDQVAQVRAQSPQDWTELLGSVGLETISAQPLVECCQSGQAASSALSNHSQMPSPVN